MDSRPEGAARGREEGNKAVMSGASRVQFAKENNGKSQIMWNVYLLKGVNELSGE